MEIHHPRFNPYLRRKIEIIDIIVILLFLIITLVGLLNYNSLQGKIAEGVLALGLVGLFVISALIDFLPNFFNPLMATAIAIVAGVNVHIAILATILGSILGSFAGFELGYRKGFKYVSVFFEPKTFKEFYNFITRFGKWFLLISALTPLPDFTILFGAFMFKRRDFVIFWLIPRVLMMVFLGYGLYYGISLF